MSGSQMSPLTLALLTGGSGSGGMNPYMLQNPGVLKAATRLQFGEHLANSALDSSPAYPAQALSRLGQALLGGLTIRGGLSDLDTAAQDQQKGLESGLSYLRGDTSPAAPATPTAAPQAAAAPTLAATDATPLAGAMHKLEGNPGGGVYADAGSPAVGPGVHQAALTDVNRAQGTNYTMDQLAADPALGTKVGDAYLALQQKRFPGRPDLALAAYNAGPTATANAVSSGAGVAGLPQSTQDYAAKGTAMAGQPAASPNPAMPATGLQSPMVARAFSMMQRAQDVLARHPFPYDPLHIAAQGQIAQAQMLAGLDTFAPGPGGSQVNVRTGQVTYPPSQRFATDAQGNLIQGTPTGGTHVVAPNATGITGSTPDANAMRIIASIGPKILDGTATPQEHANYATAAEVYQGAQIHTGPKGELLRIPVRSLPHGMPPPGWSPPAQSDALTAPPTETPAPAIGTPNASGVTPLTEGSLGPKAAASINTAAGSEDEKLAAERQALVMKNHNMLGTTSTIRATLPEVTTGVGADARLKAAQVFTALGVDPATAQQWVGTNAAPGEILQKKLFELTTGAVRAMGAREPGSVMLQFAKNYPQMSSRNMTIDAMTRLLDMDQIQQEDDIGGQRTHLAGQVGGVAEGKPYTGMTGYQQPDPRVYQAAALASGGMPNSVWTQGLTHQQQVAALKLAARVYPDASAFDRDGNRRPVIPQRAGNAGQP